MFGAGNPEMGGRGEFESKETEQAETTNDSFSIDNDNLNKDKEASPKMETQLVEASKEIAHEIYLLMGETVRPQTIFQEYEFTELAKFAVKAFADKFLERLNSSTDSKIRQSFYDRNFNRHDQSLLPESEDMNMAIGMAISKLSAQLIDMREFCVNGLKQSNTNGIELVAQIRDAFDKTDQEMKEKVPGIIKNHVRSKFWS